MPTFHFNVPPPEFVRLTVPEPVYTQLAGVKVKLVVLNCSAGCAVIVIETAVVAGLFVTDCPVIGSTAVTVTVAE